MTERILLRFHKVGVANKANYLVFTDLDGTLLDHDAYTWQPAAPAIQRLIEASIPWLFVTSKTRAETEVWRLRTGNRHPFIVENGGAAYIPSGYFPAPVAGAVRKDGFDVLEWGASYSRLVSELAHAAALSNCHVRGFHDMDAEEVADLCGLPLDLAVLAKQREYDEPFVVTDMERSKQLVEAIEARGLRCTRGGRFWHIMGANDKGAAVRVVAGLYQQPGSPRITIGLGDGMNDVAFLKEVAIPVVIQSPQSEDMLRLVSGARLTEDPGPTGWAEALRKIIPALQVVP